MKTGRFVTCSFCYQAVRLRMLPRHLVRKCPNKPTIMADQHICSVCQTIKARTEFPHSSLKPLGIDNRCKSCHAAHRNKWAQEIKDGERKLTRRFVERPGAWVLRPCKYCGDTFNAREIKPHQTRCAKKPLDKCKIAGPLKIKARTEREERQSYRLANRKMFEREGNLKSKYGIDMVEYRRLFEAQGGVCAICKLPPLCANKRDQVLHVDHDHVTGKIRALLCHSCNHLIGHAKESVAVLMQAIAYLLKHSPIA